MQSLDQASRQSTIHLRFFPAFVGTGNASADRALTSCNHSLSSSRSPETTEWSFVSRKESQVGELDSLCDVEGLRIGPPSNPPGTRPRRLAIPAGASQPSCWPETREDHRQPAKPRQDQRGPRSESALKSTAP